MEQITMIGLDLAKHVFQLHGIGASGTVLLRKAVRRGQLLAFFSGLPPCTVAMEACPTAHHWARELVTLGHGVRLMPPKYVKGVREAEQERRGRRRGDLRGGGPAEHGRERRSRSCR